MGACVGGRGRPEKEQALASSVLPAFPFTPQELYQEVLFEPPFQ